MVLKIITFFFLPFLFIAIILSTFGVQQISLDDNFYGFIIKVNTRMSQYGDWLSWLPNISSIPLMPSNGADWYLVLNVLITLVNGITSVVNGLLEFIRFAWRTLEWIIAFLDVLFSGIDWFVPNV